MSLLETLFPGWALKRAQARYALQNYYEASKPSDYRKRRTDKGSGDAVVKSAGDNLRIQARHLEQNLDIAKGILDVMTANIVGMGVRPEFQLKTKNGELADEVNAQLLRLWGDWIRNPEVTGELDFYSAQRLACRSWIRDGEVFTQIVAGNIRTLNHRSLVPLSIELIESDYVPMELDDKDKGIIQGVQKNKWGQPKNYFVYKEHPGDASSFVSVTDVKSIPADRMIHLKRADRIKQTRGVTDFATILNRLDDIKDIEESERIAARVAAAMTGYIKKGNPDLFNPTLDAGYREMEMEPGMIFDDLLPGEDIGTIVSNRPNNQLIPFRDAQLRAVASGVGASFSSISKNYNGTYSAQRQELVEQYAIYGIYWSQFAEGWVRKIVDRFVELAVMQVEGEYDETTLYDVELSRPALVHIDPFKEATASERLVAAGFMSRSQVIRAHGKNPDETLRQIVKERKEAEEYGIMFSTDAGVAPQPQSDVGADAKKATDSNNSGNEDNQDGANEEN